MPTLDAFISSRYSCPQGVSFQLLTLNLSQIINKETKCKIMNNEV